MRKLIVGIAILVLSIQVHAQDRNFAWTYTSVVLPKGAVDLEGWHTSRMGHEDQFYHAQDHRLEVEIGLGGNLQTAFYFNQFLERVSKGTDGTELEVETGFSNEWKWQVKKPVGKKTGIALYSELGLKGGDEVEVETKVILDKTIGKNLFAFNAVLEMEKEFSWAGNETVSQPWSTPLEFDFAYMRNISPTVGLGLELRDVNAISKEDHWKYSMLAGGPTINIRGNNWFIIGNFQPQLGNLHKTTLSPGSKILDDQEKNSFRILFGVSLR
jgi:hypothetical protein